MNVCLGTNEARFPSNLSPSHRIRGGRCLSKTYNKSSLNRKKFVHKYFSSQNRLLLIFCCVRASNGECSFSSKFRFPQFYFFTVQSSSFSINFALELSQTHKSNFPPQSCFPGPAADGSASDNVHTSLRVRWSKWKIDTSCRTFSPSDIQRRSLSMRARLVVGIVKILLIPAG